MQKFIITQQGELRFGDVRMHKDLLPLFENECHGGGQWKIDAGGMSIVLYGRSFDFGKHDFSKVRRINWSGIGGKPAPLFYYPDYPDMETSEPIFAKP